MKESILSRIKNVKKEQLAVCGLLGLLLMTAGIPVKKDTGREEQKAGKMTEVQEEREDIRMEYEQQLAEALSQVQGVGQVKVSVTMESTVKRIVEKDVPRETGSSSQKDDQGRENTSQSESCGETTVYEETMDGMQTPYITSSVYPEIRGVLVIAQGGDSPYTVRQIQEAVMALFHVEAHKIKVLKMK